MFKFALLSFLKTPIHKPSVNLPLCIHEISDIFFLSQFFNLRDKRVPIKYIYNNFIVYTNILYNIFIRRLPFFLISKNFFIFETKSFNKLLRLSQKKKPPVIAIALDSKLLRKELFFFSENNYFLITPSNNYTQYTNTHYPLYLNLTTDINVYIYYSFIKFFFFKVNSLNFKNNLYFYLNKTLFFKKHFIL